MLFWSVLLIDNKNKIKNMKILTNEELENMNQVMTSIGSLIIAANS